MKLKLALAALVLAAMPTFAAAMCEHGEKSMSTSMCADGQTWDAPTQTCVDTNA